MQARLKPCIKIENINHRACTNEGCSLFLYRAQPVGEMEREAGNRAARQEPDGAKAQPVIFDHIFFIYYKKLPADT